MGATTTAPTAVNSTLSTANSGSRTLVGGDEPLVNRDLISLKCVLFLVYGGLAALYSTLIPHMLALGLNYPEARLILITVPLVACIGPLAVAPLADRLAQQKQALSGRYLRILIAVTLLLGACAYAALLAVPAVQRAPAQPPRVSFGCHADGATIYQQRCANADATEQSACYAWPAERRGSLVLSNCTYTCKSREAPTEFERLSSTRTTPADLLRVEEVSASTEALSSREHAGGLSEDYDGDYQVRV